MRLYIIKDLFTVLALFGLLFVVASMDMRFTPNGVVVTLGEYGYYFETRGVNQ